MIPGGAVPRATLLPAPGARVVIRDAEWIVRRVDDSSDGGWQLTCDGVSELVRGRTALFLTELEDEVRVLDPGQTQFVQDTSPRYAASLLHNGHQRIYGRNKVVLSKCGIDIRGRARKLRVNYRTTEEIRKAAVALLEGCAVDDLDGGVDSQQAYKSLTHGDPPVRRHFGSPEDQSAEIEKLIGDWRGQNVPASSICVVARTNAELEDIERRLHQRGIAARKIRVEEADTGAADAVRLATMPRAKGLEFDRVIVASVNEGLAPRVAGGISQDPVERAMTELEERALLYVGLTRARTSAALLSYGQPSSFLARR
jgi:UvrD-like helicase C-terminal domain